MRNYRPDALLIAAFLTACAATPACRRTTTTSHGSDKPGSCVREMAVGFDSICYLVTGAYYLCRGRAMHGLLGDGNDPLAPPEFRGFDHDYVALPKRFSGLQLGSLRACGLDPQHHLWCWGSAGVQHPQQAVPVEQTELGEVDEFSLFDALCARRGDRVRCQGLRSQQTMAEVDGLPSGIRHVAAGQHFGCAATEHEVYCFGRMDWANNHGSPHGSSYSAGVYDSWDRPVRIEGPELDIADLQVGTMSGCVLTRQGKVYCFGSNDYGNLGNGEAISCQDPCPEQNFRMLSEVAAVGRDVKELNVVAGACALKADGSVWCWGENMAHRISPNEHQVSVKVNAFGGTNVTSWPLEPTPVEVTALGKDNLHLHARGPTCVVKNSGAIWCWGENRYSEIARCGYEISCPAQEVKVPCP